MIDSLKLRSEPLSKAAVAAVVEASERRCLFAPGGDLVWEITTGELVGSFDHRLAVRLRSDTLGRDCLEVEGSVHKHLLGHNVHGGPMDARPCGRYLVAALERHFGASFGDADSWEVRRVDVALPFDLGTEDAVEERINHEKFMVANTTGKLKIQTHPTGWNTVRSKGGAVRLKCYAKGAELHKHDGKRLRRSECDYADLLAQASRIIRYEVEFYGPLISKVTTGGRLGTLDSAGLHHLAIWRMGEFLRENMGTINRVRTSQAVEKRLRDVYGIRLGGLLYGTWLKLATNGEENVRDSMNRATFYRQKKKLFEAGCVWVDTDVMRLELMSRVPSDFAISLSSPYYLGATAPQVDLALAPFAA